MISSNLLRIEQFSVFSVSSVPRWCFLHLWPVWVVACPIMTGCSGPDGPQRVAVEGKVTLNGAPLAKGSIRFVPQRPARGPRVGGPIVDGRYRLEQPGGPVVGTMRVEIWPDESDLLRQALANPTESRKHAPAKLPANQIPVRYNDQSNLVVETTSEGPNRFDFELFSK